MINEFIIYSYYMFMGYSLVAQCMYELTITRLPGRLLKKNSFTKLWMNRCQLDLNLSPCMILNTHIVPSKVSLTRWEKLLWISRDLFTFFASLNIFINLTCFTWYSRSLHVCDCVWVRRKPGSARGWNPRPSVGCRQSEQDLTSKQPQWPETPGSFLRHSLKPRSSL